MPEGLWRGHVEASASDELPFDNRRFLALQVAPPARVLLVDGDRGGPHMSRRPTSSRPHCGWRRRARHYAKTPFDSRAVELVGGTGLPDLEKTEAVVLANVDNLGTADAKRLGDFVDRGGGLLVFTGDRVRPEAARVLEAAGLGVGEVLEAKTATELPWRLERWDSGTWSSSRLPTLSTATFAGRRSRRSHRSSRTTMPASWRGSGAASPRSWNEPRGGVKSSGSPRDATWPGAIGRAGGCTCPCFIRWSPTYPAWPKGAGSAKRSPAATGNRVSSRSMASSTSSTPIHLNPKQRGARPRNSPADSASHCPSPPRWPWPGRAGTKGIADDRLRSDEIWPWLALTLVGLLLAENFLANRTAA